MIHMIIMLMMTIMPMPTLAAKPILKPMIMPIMVPGSMLIVVPMCRPAA
jgi:hypothetical protein